MITEERNTSLTFPVITLCNLNSRANNNMPQGHMKAYMEAAGATDTKEGFNKSHLFDSATLFANIAPNSNKANAHQFLLTCQWDVLQEGAKLCGPKDSHMFMYKASLGYCFTLTLAVNSGFVAGFSAILYLDDSFECSVPFYKLTINTPLSLGAILFVHQRNTLPDLSSGAVLLSGRSSHVSIHVQQRIRQPYPYSECTHQTTLPYALEYRYNNKPA